MGREREASCRRGRLRRPCRAKVVAVNGCGTQGLPRSASYSTTMNGAPGRRCDASDRMTATWRSRGTKWRLLAATNPSSGGSARRGGEVGDEGRQRQDREARGQDFRVRPQRAGVPIERDDPGARAEQVGEGQRERPLPRADVRPGAAGAWIPPSMRATWSSMIPSLQPTSRADGEAGRVRRRRYRRTGGSQRREIGPLAYMPVPDV